MNNCKNITFTRLAEEKISEVISKNPDQVMRISLEGGGCAGFIYNYQIDTIDKTSEECDVFLRGSNNCTLAVIDNESIKYFGENSIIDFKSNTTDSSVVIINTLASAGCGCNQSFSIKADQISSIMSNGN